MMWESDDERQERRERERVASVDALHRKFDDIDTRDEWYGVDEPDSEVAAFWRDKAVEQRSRAFRAEDLVVRSTLHPDNRLARQIAWGAVFTLYLSAWPTWASEAHELGRFLGRTYSEGHSPQWLRVAIAPAVVAFCLFPLWLYGWWVHVAFRSERRRSWLVVKGLAFFIVIPLLVYSLFRPVR